MFRAHEADGDRLVAVKVFRLDLTPEQSAALVDQFHALIARDISHPNIAAPIAAGVDLGAAYLAQEYALGDSLDVLLRDRGPMLISDAVPLIESLAAAVDHAAERGVHHGTLHLRDIILSADSVRMTGLGISAALKEVSAKLPTRPQYAPPNGPSDIYSLGAIAFEMVTGKRASQDNLNEFEEEYGGELRSAFETALAVNAEQRVRHAADFARAVRNAAGTMSTAAFVAPAFAQGASADEPIAPEVLAPDIAAFVPEEELESIAPNEPIEPDEPAEPAEPDRSDDLDLRLDRPADLMADAEGDLADGMIPSTVATFPAAWTAQPPRVFEAVDGPAEPPGRRWPIVATFVGFAVLVALSVGWFLRSPVPVASREPKPGVDETTVDLPANPSLAPPREAPSALPAPTPSRPASGAVARTAKPASGSLLIRSSPADADVLVNGRPRGKTPLTLRDLATGSYTIRVARDGYATEERELQVTARRPTASTTFNLRPTAGLGGINVQSRPPGARVFVNDQAVGSTPLVLPGLPAGSATVRIEMDGYQTWMTRVDVVPGEQARVAASLEGK